MRSNVQPTNFIMCLQDSRQGGGSGVAGQMTENRNEGGGISAEMYD